LRKINDADISAGYGSLDKEILRGINFKIEPGEFVALTGPSGGGKTTLFKLLLGLYEPWRGEIWLDGERATPQIWRAWREKVGAVSQDDRLLSGTIAENIALFDPQIDMGQIENAARFAKIYDEIHAMPMRFRSLIGDMGSVLSGGQRQRVMLARAIYRNPSVLMLDEGTANLDVDAEEAIAESIRALPVTRIVIAHRPALLDRADRIVEVRDGALNLMGRK